MPELDDIAATISAAHTLMGDEHTAPAAKDLADALTEEDAFIELPSEQQAAAMQCVDGAVAAERTDALVWIAAVATDSSQRFLRTKTAVAPISSAIDPFKSAVMALCEMSVAREVCDAHGHAWMDGGLVTPLLSLATGLLIDDRETSAQLCALLEDVDAAGIVDDYLGFALDGQLAALPKQDTATSYCESWSRTLEGITSPTRIWLSRQRDRTVAGLVAPAGHFVAPRRGVEALRVEAKAPSRGDRRASEWSSHLDALLAEWRSDVQPWVTYVSPRDSDTGRATKVEFTTSDKDDIPAMAALRCSQAADGIAGSRVLEPLAQYLVDTFAKRDVQGVLAELLSAATNSFAETNPAAVRHYRT